MTQTDLIYPELSYRLVGILMKVHAKLGPGYQEKHYQKAVELELDKNKIKFFREKPFNLYYDKIKIGIYYFDFIVEDKIVLEIKAVEKMHSLFTQQLLSYLKSTGLKLGILANFGQDKLYCKRLVN